MHLFRRQYTNVYFCCKSLFSHITAGFTDNSSTVQSTSDRYSKSVLIFTVYNYSQIIYHHNSKCKINVLSFYSLSCLFKDDIQLESSILRKVLNGVSKYNNM